MFFGWDNFKKAFLEWLKTFSNEDSWLSSKRLDRFVLTTTAIALSVFVVIYNRGKWSALDNIIVIGPLFGYAGFSLTKTEKEKTLINQTNGNDTKQNE